MCSHQEKKKKEKKSGRVSSPKKISKAWDSFLLPIFDCVPSSSHYRAVYSEMHPIFLFVIAVNVIHSCENWQEKASGD
jgi:hypothetical protein